MHLPRFPILPRAAGVDAGAAKPGQGGDREAVEGAATHSVRVDTGVEAGGEVSQFYDPMIAKLIVHEGTREAAAERLAEACAEVQVWPVRTNAGFLVRCLEHPRFVSGDVDTGFIAAEESALSLPPDLKTLALAGAALELDRWRPLLHRTGEYSPWDEPEGFGFRLNRAAGADVVMAVEGERQTVTLVRDGQSGFCEAGPDGRKIDIDYGGPRYAPRPPAVTVGGFQMGRHTLEDGSFVLFALGGGYRVAPYRATGVATADASDGALRAPMPGKIVAAPAKPGDAVTKGQPIVVLEAMKMEHALVAPFDGVVGEIGVAVGDQVPADAVLARVEAASA